MDKTNLVIAKLLQMIILASMTAWLWPTYIVGTFIYGRPPIVVRFSQVMRYLGYTWTYSRHNKTPVECIWIVLMILDKVIWMPIIGICWFLDEFLYGHDFEKTKIVAPLFIASAGRSGSTQVGLYLNQDPQLAAPNILQCFGPFLWLWRLVPVTIGRFITKDMVRNKIQSFMPPALLERHEGDPFQINTFDGVFYSFHLNYMSFVFGPKIAAIEFGLGIFAKHNRELWEEDFVHLVDRLARKTLIHYGGKNGTDHRFMLKGHFLCAIPALQREYSDARFLSILREPLARLQSAINFLRVNPADAVLGSIPWDCLAKTLVQTEEVYCKQEQEIFFKKTNTTKKTDHKMVVLKFTDFCNDLEPSLQYLYKNCFDGRSVPDEVPKFHPPRKRSNYTVNKSLEELDIDVDAFNETLKSYTEWCRDQTIQKKN